MFSLLLNLLELKEKAPVALYFQYIPPVTFPVPQEISNSDQTQVLFNELHISSLFLGNESGKVMRSLRVTFTGEMKYQPLVRGGSDSFKPEYSFDEIRKQIVVDSIDPGDSIHIETFPSDEGIRAYEKPKVIIGDTLITSGMMAAGSIRKHPWRVAALLIPIGLAICAMVFAAFAIVDQHRYRKDIEMITTALDNWQGCTPYPYDNPINNEAGLGRELERNKEMIDVILTMNKAASIEDLEKRDSLILCEVKKVK